MLDTAGWWRFGGLVLGLATGYTLASAGPYQTAAAVLAVPVFALGVGLGVLAGEVTLPRPERPRGTSAMLEVRHASDYLPQPAAKGVGLLAGVLALLVVLLLMAGLSPFRYAVDAWPTTLISAVVTAGLTLGVAWFVLAQVARSPRAGVDIEQRRRDDAWRYRTASTVTAAAGVVVSGTLSGALFLGTYQFGMYGAALPLASTVLASAVLVVFGAYAVMLLRPAQSLVDTRDTGAAKEAAAQESVAP